MNASILLRSLPGEAARRWRSLGRPGRWALRSLVVALAMISLGLASKTPADLPARATLEFPRRTWPLGFSPDGRTITTFRGDFKLRIHDLPGPAK